MKPPIYMLTVCVTLLSQVAQADFTQDIRNEININAPQVERSMGNVSDNLTAIFGHRNLAPAESLGGGLFGVELGIDATRTDLEQKYMSQVAGTNNAFDMNTVILPKFSAAIGLPAVPLDFSVSYLPEIEGFSLLSAQAKYAILEGGTVSPAVSVAASYSKASLDSAIDIKTMATDISISKGFGVGIKAIPYAGVGYIKGESSLSNSVVGNSGIQKQYDSSEAKFFAGLNLQFSLLNIAIEADKIGDYQSQSIKFGIRY